MSEFLQMEIFFFVTTIVVILIGVLLVFILIRIWSILGDVEHISHDISEESTLLRGDIGELRRKVKDEGFKLIHLRSLVTSAIKRFKRKATRKHKSEDGV